MVMKINKGILYNISMSMHKDITIEDITIEDIKKWKKELDSQPIPREVYPQRENMPYDIKRVKSLTKRKIKHCKSIISRGIMKLKQSGGFG